MNRRFREHGFTMIELLVAITLAAVVAVLGAAVLKVGVDYVQRSRDYLREQEDLRAAVKTVRYLWQGRAKDNLIGFADLLEFNSRRIDAPPTLMATRVRLTCRPEQNDADRPTAPVLATVAGPMVAPTVASVADRWLLHRELLADLKQLEKQREAEQRKKEGKSPATMPPPATPPAANPPPEGKDGKDGKSKIEWVTVYEDDLLKGLNECTFAYLLATQEKEEKVAQWVSAWTDIVNAPRLMRMNLSLRRGALPPLVFVAN